MHLKLVIFALAALAVPIDMSPSEELEKEIRLLKTKIENLEKSDHDLKIKIEKLESNEEKMEENMVKMRNENLDMKKKECGMEKKLDNSETGKENMNNDDKVKRSKKDLLNNLDKIKEDQNVLETKIPDHDNDCCDILTEKVNDINNTVTHINARLNDNTLKIIENQLEIQNNEKEIANNSKYLGDLMKRSDYCAYRYMWEENLPNQVITYDKMVLDNNVNIPAAQMDISKGVFTAGLSAIYQIGVSIRTVLGAQKITDIHLQRNGVNLDETMMAYRETNDEHDDVGGRYILMKLDAGDTVSVYVGELGGSLFDITLCINVLK